MKEYDPEGRTGPKKPLPDTVTIIEPPVDKLVSEPVSEQRGPPAPAAIPEPQAEEYAQPAPAQFEEQTYQAEPTY